MDGKERRGCLLACTNICIAGVDRERDWITRAWHEDCGYSLDKPSNLLGASNIVDWAMAA